MRSTPTPEEKMLIERSIHGDHRAQLRLYRKYVKAMYNTVIRMVPNKMDAEDIIQESFVKVFRNLKQFQGSSTLGAWIKKITINTTLNFIQRKQKISFTDLEETKGIAAINLEKKESKVDIKTIHHAIKQLPEGSRLVFTLHQIEGYQHQEIAQILGISLSTSKSQYQRARRLLQKRLTSKIKIS